MTERIVSFTQLRVYQKACELDLAVFEESKRWPKEELYSLTDQARRASRSIGANISEAWGKRRYEAHFLSKLTDADSELQETRHWVQTAIACGYLTNPDSGNLVAAYDGLGRMLGAMIVRHQSFCLR